MRIDVHGGRAMARRRGQVIALTVAFVAPGASAAVAGTLYVDRGDSACSDIGSGSSAEPFCAIGTAVGKVVADDTTQVNAGNHLEKVTIKKSGTSVAPIVSQAGPDVTLVSGQTIGFDLSGVQWVTIRGFTVGTSTERMRTQLSSNVTLDANHIQKAGARGIYAKDCTDCIPKDNVIDHSVSYGIYIQNDIGILIASGEVSYYRQPASGSIRKDGIRLHTKLSRIGNVKMYHNADSGIYRPESRSQERC